VGKDSALALHEVRSAGQVEITGLLNHGERNRQASGDAWHQYDLITKSGPNDMRYEAVWPDAWTGRSPGERQYRTG
jgi:hypothetical protein